MEFGDATYSPGINPCQGKREEAGRDGEVSASHLGALEQMSVGVGPHEAEMARPLHPYLASQEKARPQAR